MKLNQTFIRSVYHHQSRISRTKFIQFTSFLFRFFPRFFLSWNVLFPQSKMTIIQSDQWSRSQTIWVCCCCLMLYDGVGNGKIFFVWIFVFVLLFNWTHSFYSYYLLLFGWVRIRLSFTTDPNRNEEDKKMIQCPI